MTGLIRLAEKIKRTLERMVLMMAMFFAQRVILGKNTFDEVPKALKAGCAEILLESGLPELVPTEYGGTAEA